MEATSRAPGASVVNDTPRRNKRSERIHTPPGRYFEDGTALNRILTEAPYLARCSDNKTAALVRPREFALRFPYMQINRRGMVSWLIFDLDHANSLIWDDLGLPKPNLIVRNRSNGHSHLYYAISSVCTTEKGRDKPIQYMKAIYAAFAVKLQADPDYNSGPVAKTPGHPWWLTTELHDHVYDLGDLADYVSTRVSPWKKVPRLEDLPDSRHVMLFERLRYFAYSVVAEHRENGSFDTFCRALEASAHNLNTFRRQGFRTGDLPYSSLRATVRSVSRWTWAKYWGSTKCCRGAMELDSALPLAERQSLAAKRTHDLRHKATESKIRAACRGLQDRGEPLHMASIAALAGITRQTVANYPHILTEVATPSTVAILGASRADQSTPQEAELLSKIDQVHQVANSKCCHSESEPTEDGNSQANSEALQPEEMLSKRGPGAGDRGPECCHSGEQVDQSACVNYGVHQVTARRAAPLCPCVGLLLSESCSCSWGVLRHTEPQSVPYRLNPCPQSCALALPTAQISRRSALFRFARVSSMHSSPVSVPWHINPQGALCVFIQLAGLVTVLVSI